jgi:hypothetical protein
MANRKRTEKVKPLSTVPPDKAVEIRELMRLMWFATYHVAWGMSAEIAASRAGYHDSVCKSEKELAFLKKRAEEYGMVAMSEISVHELLATQAHRNIATLIALRDADGTPPAVRAKAAMDMLALQGVTPKAAPAYDPLEKYMKEMATWTRAEILAFLQTKKLPDRFSGSPQAQQEPDAPDPRSGVEVVVPTGDEDQDDIEDGVIVEEEEEGYMG